MSKMKGWSYSAVTLIVMVMSLSNNAQANDSSYLKHLKQCLNPVFLEANAHKIIPVFAIKDSIEGVCFLSLVDLSNVLDSNIVYSAYYVDSLISNKINFNLNKIDGSKFTNRFLSLKEFLFDQDLIAKNFLLKGRRKTLFKHVLYIDHRSSDQNQYLWIWNELKNGNYYQWSTCEGIFTKEDYFYCLYAR